MFIRVLFCLIFGYAFGLFQTGYIYGRIVHGIDIREYGSHSAGATNTVRTLGKAAGYIVFLGDVLKMIIAVCLVRFAIFPGQSYTDTLMMVTAVGVILGHDFPFYMHFKGGKGISATGGLMIAMNPLIAVIESVFFLAAIFSTHYISVGSLTVTAIFPFMVLIFFPEEPWVFILALVITAIDWWQHRANIQRLRNGTENRFGKKNK